MSRFITQPARILRKIALFFRVVKYKIKVKTGLLGRPVIQPYYGYGNQKEIVVQGRVVENNVLSKPLHKLRKWDNLVAMYKRYLSDSIPNASVGVTFDGQWKKAIADKMGYFDVSFQLKSPLNADIDWFKADIELLDKIVRNQRQIRSTGHVMVSEKNSQFGIISDVDDTIIVSKATQFLKKIRLLLLKNAHTRLPFEGVAAFYQALQKGQTGTRFNPIFYVSSSSWKLYDLLVDFCEVKKIPKGPFFLRSSRLDQYKFISSIHTDHKLNQIERILSVYEGLKFILIGDSGQKDPEIYAQVVKDFPGRIEAIFIRDVSKRQREERVNQLAERVAREHQVDMIYVQNTEEAAIHAVNRGYISRECVKDIIGEKTREEIFSDDPDELEQEEVAESDVKS